MCPTLAPQYLRHCCASDDMNEARVGLTTLAEVYRAARVLWPLRKWGGDEGWELRDGGWPGPVRSGLVW